jgi:hypothetical protein
MNDLSKSKIKKAVDIGIEAYIHTRYKAVTPFCEKYFSFMGACRLHKKALGRDLYRVPLNIAWAVPYLCVRSGSIILRKIGNRNIVHLLEKMPPGFKTEVQKEVEWLIITELLELPYEQNKRLSKKDMLLTSILEQEMISGELHSMLTKIGAKAEDAAFKEALSVKLSEYNTSRTATADLSGNILMLASGYLAFQKATPGAISGGTALATVMAQHFAISNSWWPFFYSFWYSLFPVTPSLGLIAASTGALMAGLAIITTFSGIIADPLQAKLGIHQRRLKKLINSLEDELKGKTVSEFRLRDIYAARIFDFLDILKSVSKLA